LAAAFRRADQVLLQATRGISDLITVHGFINLDFADVKAVMSEGGDALMGVGVAKGENRAVEATQQAIASPFMEEVAIGGARAVLANITGNLTFDDYHEASNVVHEAVGDEANIFIGAVVDPTMGDEVRVTIIATGFNGVKTQRVGAAAAAGQRYGDPTRLVEYRPQRLVTDRPVISASASEGGEGAGQAQKITLERPSSGPVMIDDRNIPAFLRKQLD
jgi:cell division protein FtsZ